MVLETKSGLEGAVIGGGHSVAASRLDAQRSVAGWVSEQMGGLSYLFYIRDLVSPVLPSLSHKPCKLDVYSSSSILFLWVFVWLSSQCVNRSSCHQILHPVPVHFCGCQANL